MKKNNKFKFGIEGTLITALVIAAVILLNVFFTLLGNKFDLKADLTGGGVFTLSKETKEVVEASDQAVNVYYATNAQNRNSRYAEILDAFSKESSNITVKEVNLDTDPGFSRKYQIKSYNSVVVECEETNKKRVIDNSLIEQKSTNENGAEAMNMNYLESYLSAAIRYVTSEDPLLLYITVGHGEIVENPTFLDYVMNMFYSEAMSVKILNLTTDQIPGEADMLLIAGPTIDYTTDEIKKLDDYMEAGGRVQFYSNPSYSLPNFNAYLQNNWGITVNNNCVSDENSGYVAASSIGNYLIPQLRQHAMTDYFRSTGMKIRVQEGELNSITVTEYEGVEANTLLSTSETGVSMTRENWVKKNNREAYDPDEQGEINLMVYLRKNAINNQETTSRLLVSGSYYLLFDRLIDTSSSYGDKDLVVKSINYMSGIEDAPISVAAKEVRKEKMEVLETSKLTACISFLVIAIPLILFACGIYVYIRRKNL